MIGRICGTGSYIPSHRMDNVELSSLVDTSDEWIRERIQEFKADISQNRRRYLLWLQKQQKKLLQTAG